MDAFSINPAGCTSIPHILNERSGCLYWEVTYILHFTIHFSPKYKLAGPSFSEFPSLVIISVANMIILSCIEEMAQAFSE